MQWDQAAIRVCRRCHIFRERISESLQPSRHHQPRSEHHRAGLRERWKLFVAQLSVLFIARLIDERDAADRGEIYPALSQHTNIGLEPKLFDFARHCRQADVRRTAIAQSQPEFDCSSASVHVRESLARHARPVAQPFDSLLGGGLRGQPASAERQPNLSGGDRFRPFQRAEAVGRQSQSNSNVFSQRRFRQLDAIEQQLDSRRVLFHAKRLRHAGLVWKPYQWIRLENIQLRH